MQGNRRGSAKHKDLTRPLLLRAPTSALGLRHSRRAPVYRTSRPGGDAAMRGSEATSALTGQRAAAGRRALATDVEPGRRCPARRGKARHGGSHRHGRSSSGVGATRCRRCCRRIRHLRRRNTLRHHPRTRDRSSSSSSNWAETSGGVLRTIRQTSKARNQSGGSAATRERES